MVASEASVICFAVVIFITGERMKAVIWRHHDGVAGFVHCYSSAVLANDLGFTPPLSCSFSAAHS
jgi:hypothetical protein